MRLIPGAALAALSALCTLCIIACDNSGTEPQPSGADPLIGEWVGSTSTLLNGEWQKDSTSTHSVFSADGKYSTSLELFDWDDTTKSWVQDGTYLTEGTWARYPESNAYVKIDQQVSIGGNVQYTSEILHVDILADSLAVIPSAILKGASNDLVGKWTSILEAGKIDFRINKLMWSFEATPDGKYIPELVDFPDMTYAKTAAGFAIQSEGYLEAEFRTEFKNKTLYLQHPKRLQQMKRKK